MLRRNAAFTLMELMIVVVIIAVMAAVAIPSMTGMADAGRLKGSSRELRNLMRFARTEAIFNERTTNVFLDVQEREFWFDPRRTNEDDNVDLPPGVESSDDRRRKKESNRYSGKQFEGKRKLEKNVSFDEVSTLAENIIDEKIVAIDFYPDGTATPVLVSLVNVKGKKLTLEVLRSTGLVEVTPGSMEEKQAKLSEAPPPPPPNSGPEQVE